MKALIVFIALSTTVVSCSKEKISVRTIADKFTGEWEVWEESQDGRSYNSSVFSSTIFKENDSTFGLIESNRTTIPLCIYWPEFIDYRTIYFQVDEANREIKSTKPFCSGKYSLNRDTIQFVFEVPTYYYVRQRLIRQ